MALDKVLGIVLKEIPSGESNKHIVVLTREHGKMLLSAKGARNAKSKFVSGTQLFSYAYFHILTGNGFSSINHIDLIENFYELRCDIVKFAYAAYICEVAEKTLHEEMDCEEILRLILITLNLAEKSQQDIKLIVSVFQLKYLQIIGLMPDINQCGVCGRKGEMFDIINVNDGFVVCDGCGYSIGNMNISKGTFRAVKFVLEKDFTSCFKFNLDENVLREFSSFSNRYFQAHIGESFKTLEFAESLF